MERIIADKPPGPEFFEDEEREGFFVSSMMKRYWASQIKVLSEIDRICKKHGIKWFADYGTLLGAVRHGGFIPWDDDLDICMLRHDWVRFFDIAKEELPAEYCVLTLKYEEDYEQALGRVVNSHAIDSSQEHMTEFFGCPYTVGVDVFPLDGLFDDEEKEENRIRLAKTVQSVYEQVASDKMSAKECADYLSEIGISDCSLPNDKGKILKEIRRMTEKLYKMYPSENAKNVALMQFWVSNRSHKYNIELFRETISLPFEYTHIQVPARYNEVLSLEYGNYMAVHKGGGLHDYPSYKAQEKILKEKSGRNPFRFNMTKEEVNTFDREKTRIEKCYEMTQMLLLAHKQIQELIKAGKAELAGNVLSSCQSLAISLGTFMEDKMPKSESLVHMLEEYCEIVYLAGVSWSENSSDDLNRKMEAIEKAIQDYFDQNKKEVLFLPCKSGWWRSMEKLYEDYCSDSDADVYIMPLSYLSGDRLTGVNGGEHNDSSFFLNKPNVVSNEEYDIAERHPDVIVIQYPYDEWGVTIDIPEFFYAKKLTSYTDKLIYVPWFDVDPPLNEEDKAVEAIEKMIEQPAVLYADQVIVSSEGLRELYINTLTGITGSSEKWESKIIVSDRRDTRQISHANEDDQLPEKWKSNVGNRKIMIFGVNASFILENGMHAITKLKDSMETIDETASSMVCVYVPDSDIEAIKQIDSDLWEGYVQFNESIKNKENVIINKERIPDSYMSYVSGYYGSAGVLAHRCRNMGKPVMIMKA